MSLLTPTSDDTAVLSRMRMFSGLPDTELSKIAKQASLRIADRGETLFKYGDDSDKFYGVISGWVKLFKTGADGNEVVLGVFTQGETFAEATLFMSGVYPATAEVVTPVRLFEFERDYFVEEILCNASLCLGMFASLSIHLHRLTQEIEQLQGQNGEQRLIRFLLSFCVGVDGTCRIRLPFEKTLIAGRLGMKPETLSRNFSRLKPLGVQVERDEVRIKDISRLRAVIS